MPKFTPGKKGHSTGVGCHAGGNAVLRSTYEQLRAPPALAAQPLPGTHSQSGLVGPLWLQQGYQSSNSQTPASRHIRVFPNSHP